MKSQNKLKKKTENPQNPKNIVALAGNPNVGKSTVFNRLTGLKQHTGNWPGKTVGSAEGEYSFKGQSYTMVDLPGTYSLMAHSAEEEVARDFILFGGANVAAVVCDATCLERNLNLVSQTIEITPNVVVCVNMMDEAEKKSIRIHVEKLEKMLGVPVVTTNATRGRGVSAFMEKVSLVIQDKIPLRPIQIQYSAEIEKALEEIFPCLPADTKGIHPRWIALKLLLQDTAVLQKLVEYLKDDFIDEKLKAAVLSASESFQDKKQLEDAVVSCIVRQAENVTKSCVIFEKSDYNARDRKIDKFLTSKKTGIPVMLLLLFGILWLTITGANYPSKLLAEGLFWVQDRLTDFFLWINAPDWLHGALVLGVYRVLAWVVSVMLPPMAIFFPLFTLLEDLGYLPRIAFNLDKGFKRCCACGKQALTMCMGFGCNAAGVIGCRIIDSPRERLIAIITNNFVPCNGRFPTIIAVSTMFFVGFAAGLFQSLLSALILTGVIVLGVLMTFFVSKMLSKTFLKGVPSSFTLELPPYRKPQILKVIVRSIFDRTLFVLGRALVVAAPAGLVIWLMANIGIDGSSLLSHCTEFLDPFAKLLGLDGVILLAFILGFPANEIVIPIMIMAYLSKGHIMELDSLSQLKTLLVDNGWTAVTAVCTILFSLMHWPCSTTCLTIKKETQSLKWTALSVLIPTVIGMIVCFIVASSVKLIGLL